MQVREPQPSDVPALLALAASLIGERRAASSVRAHIERRQLLVADADGDIAGFLAYKTDWFDCTFVSLVVVAEPHRRRGVARALFEDLERRMSNPRLFSSTEETNVVSVRMHRTLGFTASGHIDNLPQGYRELLFYKRVR